jgi:hypothetical protein
MTKKIYILLMLFSLGAFSQQKQVITTVDKTKNKLGGQFTLTLKTTVDTAATVVFPTGKQFGALEVIRDYGTDTVKTDGRYELVRKYGLTQFDSGKYTIPQLGVLINKKPFLTDSIKVEVAPVAVDTLKQKMYDIKDVVHSKGENAPWWLYVLIVLGLIALGFLIAKLIKKYRKPRAEKIIYKTPIEKATVLLQQLEGKEFLEKGEIKNYYSELTDIARNYIEEAIHIPAMESTTSELIAALRIAAVKKHMSLTPETVENLERILRQADLVKFAKSKPLDFEIADDRKKLESTIVTIDKSIPDVIDEEAEAAESAAMIAKKIKDRKRKKVLTVIGFVAGFVIAFFAGLVITKGFSYIRDNVFGESTKELLEGDWVYSEYGDPSISIETPKVLMRADAGKLMNKNAYAVIKEMKVFESGNLYGKLYVLAGTMRYKDSAAIDLNVVADGHIKEWENQGGQNILVKKEDFSTSEGVAGLKAYGTMSMLDKSRHESHKLYYEMLLFKQDQGLQEVLVCHEEGDKEGGEILSRIINSVELKRAAE